MIEEFKKFIMKGNVLDLAVAVVIGAAFGAIVTSLVNDLITPILGLLMGGVDFSNLFIPLDGGVYLTLAEAQEAGAAVFAWGNFIQQIINFLVVSFAIFMLLKAYNSTQKKAEEAPAAPPEPSAEEKLLAEIRDLLARR